MVDDKVDDDGIEHEGPEFATQLLDFDIPSSRLTDYSPTFYCHLPSRPTRLTRHNMTEVASTSTAPTVALELRLRALEARVLGVPSSQLRSQPSGSQPLSRRLNNLSERVDEVLSSSPALRQFHDRCALCFAVGRLLTIDDNYAPLLRGSPDDKETGVTLADVVPDDAKVAIVVEAREDIKDAERGLREVEVLASRDVAGAGDLDSKFPRQGCSLPNLQRLTSEIVELRPVLEKGRERLATRREKLAVERRDVSALVERYSEFVSAKLG